MEVTQNYLTCRARTDEHNAVSHGFLIELCELTALQRNKAVAKTHQNTQHKLNKYTYKVVGNGHRLEDNRDKHAVGNTEHHRAYSESAQLNKACKAPNASVKMQEPEYRNAYYCINGRKLQPRHKILAGYLGIIAIVAKPQCKEISTEYHAKVVDNESRGQNMLFREYSFYKALAFASYREVCIVIPDSIGNLNPIGNQNDKQ